MRIGLCIEPVLPEMDLLERVQAVGELGFRDLEIWDPEGRDLGALRRAADGAGSRFYSCTVARCWADGSLSAESRSVVESFRRTQPHLERLGAGMAIILSGNEDPSLPPGKQRERIVANLRAVASHAERAGVVLLLEPLNTRVDHAGYFLAGSAEGFGIVREVGSPAVRLLYDIYHMQVMEGNILGTVRENLDLVGHFHAAGVPGRHELWEGELDYRRILDELDRAGYRGRVGLEYWPQGDHRGSLEKTARYLGLS